YFSSCFSDETMASYLEIGPEDRMIRIVRLNRKNGKPSSVEEIYLIQSLINDSDYNNLNKLLDLKGYIDEGSVTQKFLPITVPVKYINLLHVKLNTPIIMVESIIVSKNGTPVVYIREFNNPFEKIIEITT
ncbi:MAG: UTRA domain-containing protein, partial [Lacrimispora celerecrescens]|nr:UTRA domain-containing protein [Lacrimispora celerecrescens]